MAAASISGSRGPRVVCITILILVGLGAGKADARTIAVSPGTVAIIGDGDAEPIVLDGGQKTSRFPMIRNMGGVNLTLQRVTIRNAVMEDTDPLGAMAAAVDWTGGGRVVLDHCFIEANEVGAANTWDRCGGVRVLGGPEVIVTACRFAGNRGGDFISDFLTMGTGAVTIERSIFEGSDPGASDGFVVMIYQAGLWGGNYADFGCNVIWGEDLDVNADAGADTTLLIREDPLLCSPAEGDLGALLSSSGRRPPRVESLHSTWGVHPPGTPRSRGRPR